MRYTQHIVTQVARAAKNITHGAFKMQAIGADIGHGTRYIDGVRQLVWLGRTGAQEAAAYYAGAAWIWLCREHGEPNSYAEITDEALRSVLLDLRHRLDLPKRVQQAYEDGKGDARARFAYANSR